MMYSNEREKVAQFMRRLYEQQLTTASGGNISAKTAPNRLAVTGSGYDKASLTWEHVCVVDMNGENLTPNIRPTIETQMHVRIYQLLPEVQAVVHAHPAKASTFCATEKAINTKLIAESYAVIGVPARAPYACMGTDDLAINVAKAATEANAVLMENHGVLTTGRSLLEAFDRLEVLEKAAEMTLNVAIVGGGSALTQEHLDELDMLSGKG